MMMLRLWSLLCTALWVTSVSCFTLAPRRVTTTSVGMGFIPDEEMTVDQMEVRKIANKWSQVRLLSKEEAETTLASEPEWKQAYDRYFEKYHKDMDEVAELMNRIKKSIDPPRIQKKSMAQRKRDKWAKVQARLAARAAAAAAATPTKSE